MFTEKSGGKSQQNQYFGNIANAAQIQYAVIIRGGRTEHESAAFIAMTHTGYKQKAGELECGLLSVYCVFDGQGTGDLACGDQLL